MKRVVTALLSGVAFFGIFAPSAQAQFAEGLYVQAGGGASFPNRIGTSLGTAINLNTGYTAFGAIGYGINNGFRIEGEFAYSSFDVSSLVFQGNTSAGRGDIDTYSGLVNIYYDLLFPEITDIVSPYIGAGAGVSSISANNITAPGFTTVNGSSTVFAYQFKAGLGFRLGSSATILLGYRYFATAAPGFTDNLGTSLTTDSPNIHNVELGFRFSF
ncbi:outer membrane protein [Gloeobacter violaceus]|nr:P44/Msp2 family outer membrane protein [Gloeobacter violaceus]